MSMRPRTFFEYKSRSSVEPHSSGESHGGILGFPKQSRYSNLIRFSICRKAAEGAPFIVKDVKTEEYFVAQLKPLDDSLRRGVSMHNVLDDRGFVQYRQIIADRDLALVVYEK